MKPNPTLPPADQRATAMCARIAAASAIACLWALLVPAGASPADEQSAAGRFRAVLLTADMVTDARLQELRAAGHPAIVLMLGDAGEAAVAADRAAAQRIASSGLELFYWVEIARCPELADRHPQWMASLQGHSEWRHAHADVPQPAADEVVKVYPWTPVLYREAFDAHLERLKRLLADRPPAKGLFLNDLQGAPSACGCGNPVCRWTSDYGPIVTATPLQDDAAARFLSAAKQLVPEGTPIVPVWTTECEEHDKHTLCGGVGCYAGTCWKVYARQLTPVAAEADLLGALLLSKELGQRAPDSADPEAWIGHALKHGFGEQLVKQGRPPIAAARVVAVLQGWNATDAEIQAQIDRARNAGAAGWIVALARIDQSWQPQLVKWKR